MREDQFDVTVTVAGVPLGTYDGLTGGAKEAEESKYKPGGMAPEVSLGGSASVENVVVRRLFRQGRDDGLQGLFLAEVGRPDNAIVSKQPLDRDGNAFGRPLVYTGSLQRFAPSDHDSNSSDAAVYELEVSTSGEVAA